MSHNLHMLTAEEIQENSVAAGDLNNRNIREGTRVFTLEKVEAIIANRRKLVESDEALEALRQKLTGDNPNEPYPDTDPDMNDGPEEDPNMPQYGVQIHCPSCTQSFHVTPKPIQIRLMDMPFRGTIDRHYTYKQIVVQFEPFRIPDHACNPKYVGR